MLLIVVGALFSWLGKATESQLGLQDCLDNQRMAQLVREQIDSDRIRQVRTEGHDDLQRLENIISHIGLSGDAFVWIVDRSTSNVICHFSPTSQSYPENISEYSIIPLTPEQPEVRVIDAISNQPDRRSANGKLRHANQDYFVNAQFLPQLNAILLIGQPKSLAFRGVSALMTRANSFTILTSALLGLIATFATVLSLRKFSKRLETLNTGLEKKISKSAMELVRTQHAIIFGLAKLAESRDNDTGQHLDRIRSYVTILAEDLASLYPQVNEEMVHTLALASSLHDIGKVGIPDSILLKPGKLTNEERRIMELHTLIGGECLDAIHARMGENQFLDVARQVAYYHHERWDGTGYPHSLQGEEIPLVARIVALADVYDALTSKRPYKEALPHAESKEIILAGKGKHFDPVLVDSFLRHENEFEAISRHQLVIGDDDSISKIQRLFELLEAEDNAKEPALI